MLDCQGPEVDVSEKDAYLADITHPGMQAQQDRYRRRFANMMPLGHILATML